MNRKDLKTLSESYEKIFENTIAGILEDEPENNISNELELPNEAPSNISIGIEGNDGEYEHPECDETKEMNLTKLKSLAAHTNKIVQFITSGKKVEPWMTDKITSASDYILDVSNVIEFGE
jgi:hypothetical protein